VLVTWNFTVVCRLIRLKNGFLSYDGVPIVVNDDGNGRYHFYTQLPWPGKSKLVIELMQPSEAVLELINKTAPFYDGGVYFLGKFPSGTKTLCDVMLRWVNVCLFFSFRILLVCLSVEKLANHFPKFCVMADPNCCFIWSIEKGCSLGFFNLEHWVRLLFGFFYLEHWVRLLFGFFYLEHWVRLLFVFFYLEHWVRLLWVFSLQTFCPLPIFELFSSIVHFIRNNCLCFVC